MRERSFCCRKLVCRGVHKLQEFLIGGRQIRADLIPSLPRSYRVMCTREIIDLAERSQKGEGDEAQFSPSPFTPGLSRQSIESRHNQVVSRNDNGQKYGKCCRALMFRQRSAILFCERRGESYRS